MFLLNLYISIFEFVSDLDIRISSLGYINSTNSFVRIYKQIIQNKAKVKSAKFNLSSFQTIKYVLIGHLVIQTAKPIQSQFKPIQSQFIEKGKIDAKSAFTKDYEEKAGMGKKTNPI